MSDREWYACRDEADWTFADGPYDSWDEAALAGPEDLDLEPGETYYVGLKVPFVPRVNEDRVLDQIGSQAWDRVGEHADGWPDPTVDQAKELGRRLTDTLHRWLAEFGHTPKFFAVDNITTHTAPGYREDAE